MKREEAMEKLEKDLEAFVASGRWVEYLALQARSPQYSFGNVLSILTCRPDASHVMGLKAWNRLGRFVKKGEHGIPICAPNRKPVKTVDKNGNEVTEMRLVGFTSAYVFDVSQTEGQPLPTITDRLNGDTASGVLTAARKAYPYEIRQVGERELGAANGSYSPTTHLILLRDDLSADHTLKTLLHEWGHHLTVRPELGRVEEEVLAEAVAYMASAHFGLDTSAYSLGYLASWTDGKPIEEIKRFGEEIQKAAQNLIEAVEAALPPLPAAA